MDDLYYDLKAFLDKIVEIKMNELATIYYENENRMTHEQIRQEIR